MLLTPKKMIGNHARKIIYLSLGVVTICGFVLFFNRTPQRNIPNDGIVSPAAGRVIQIIKKESGEVVFDKKGVTNQVSIPQMNGSVWVLVIEMTPLDAHVQRAPITSTIVRMDHYDGRHDNALGKNKINLGAENEKIVTVFKSETTTVGVVQVAGMVARRIQNKKETGDRVLKGESYGRIVLGSQVVVLLPEYYTPIVQVGDRVVDGETIIAR